MKRRPIVGEVSTLWAWHGRETAVNACVKPASRRRRWNFAFVMSTAAYDSSIKKTLHLTDDVTYHVTPSVQCNGLFVNKSCMEWVSEFAALHFTTMQPHYSTAFHCTAPPELHCTASQLLHCTSLYCTHYSAPPSTPLQLTALQPHYSTESNCTASTTMHSHCYNAFHCTVLSTVHHHFTAPPLNFAALQPQCYIEFHCTESTTLHPHYSTTVRTHYISPLNSTALYLLHFTTTNPLHFITPPRLHWTVQCSTIYFISTACHCT